MKVSILVPVYKVEHLIERCANSLFGQTYKDIEYIFVDDCSPDKSIEKLLSVLKSFPERKNQVHIITHEQNRGLGIARNTAVKAATGEFVFHVDSDDFISTDCVEKCVSEQSRTNADIVSIDAIVYRRKYNEKRHLPDYRTPQDLTTGLLRREIPVNIWGRLIRLTLYKENNIKVENSVNMSEDWNVIPRLAYLSTKVSQIHDTYYYYDCRNMNSYTSSFSQEKNNQVWRTIATLESFFHGKENGLEDALRYGINKVLLIQLLETAKTSNCHAVFKELKIKQEQYGKGYDRYVDAPSKIALRINNYRLFLYYVRFASFSKQVLNRIKWYRI